MIQIKLDEGSKLYVVDAFVNNLRSMQVIRLTTNDTYFSNREAPPVTGANVILHDLTDNKQYVFNYISNGNYVYNVIAGDTISKPNHVYKLNITINGDVYTAQETQKRSATVDSIASFPEEVFGPPPEDTLYHCLLFARDKADNNADYYWIRTYANGSLADDPDEVNVCIDGTGGIVLNAPTDTIYFTPPGTFLNFKQFEKYDTCKVEVHSISRDNYFFFIQALQQISNGGLFATTPENVKTNIISPTDAKTKAIGRFNMASVVTTTKVIN